MTVAILFARADSYYKTLPDTDVYDMARDARTWPGGAPAVYHPPCRAWGQLSHMAKPRPDEKDLARWSVKMLRQFGGVLEHPAKSKLWADQQLPPVGQVDEYGGWTMPICQNWWGHRAEKKTLLYIVGVTHHDLPDYPMTLGEASHVISSSRRWYRGDTNLKPWVTHAEREHTPAALAEWLVEVARRCERVAA
jgi:hypothetical protein